MNTTLTFLLADDDEDDTALFCEALSEVNPSVACCTAENGLKALKILDSIANPPQVIFLDINMPIMNGWDCLKKLKQHPVFQHIPVIMYSTSSSSKDRQLAAAMGALCLMTKPDSFLELKGMLNIIVNNLGNLQEVLNLPGKPQALK